MRCKICDFSPDTPSLYHSSVVMPRHIKMSEDPETGEITCNCFNSSELDTDDDETYGSETEEDG